MKEEFQVKIAAETQRKNQQLLEKYHHMIAEGSSYFKMDKFFSSHQCVTLRKWMQSSSFKNLEVINFPEGGFDEEDENGEILERPPPAAIDFSNVSPEVHRHQSTSLLVSKWCQEKGMQHSAGGKKSIHRKALQSCPNFLKEFIELLYRCDNRLAYYVVKSLFSFPRGTQQWYHGDDKIDMDTIRIDRDDTTYSMIIAVEPNSKPTYIHTADYDPKDKDQPKRLRRLINERKVQISQGSFLLFRGDFPHGGAAYLSEHWRLHIAIFGGKISRCKRWMDRSTTAILIG